MAAFCCPASTSPCCPWTTTSTENMPLRSVFVFIFWGKRCCTARSIVRFDCDGINFPLQSSDDLKSKGERAISACTGLLLLPIMAGQFCRAHFAVFASKPSSISTAGVFYGPQLVCTVLDDNFLYIKALRDNNVDLPSAAKLRRLGVCSRSPRPQGLLLLPSPPASSCCYCSSHSVGCKGIQSQ